MNELTTANESSVVGSTARGPRRVTGMFISISATGKDTELSTSRCATGRLTGMSTSRSAFEQLHQPMADVQWLCNETCIFPCQNSIFVLVVYWENTFGKLSSSDCPPLPTF